MMMTTGKTSSMGDSDVFDDDDHNDCDDYEDDYDDDVDDDDNRQDLLHVPGSQL